MRKELWRQGDSESGAESLPTFLECRPAPLCLCVHAKSLESCPILCNPVDCAPPGSSVQGDSPSKNTGVGCHALLQGIFPTQVLKQSLLHLPASAAGFFTTSATWEARPGFTGAQRNQTATLSSFSHRLYCLNIFNYGFFWTDFNFTKPYIAYCWVTSLSL